MALHPPAEPIALELMQQENTRLKVAIAQLALAELAEVIAAGQGSEANGWNLLRFNTFTVAHSG